MNIQQVNSSGPVAPSRMETDPGRRAQLAEISRHMGRAFHMLRIGWNCEAADEIAKALQLRTELLAGDKVPDAI